MKKVFILMLLLLCVTIGFSQRVIGNRPIYIVNDLALDTITGGFLFSDSIFTFELPNSADKFNLHGVGDNMEIF